MVVVVVVTVVVAVKVVEVEVEVVVVVVKLLPKNPPINMTQTLNDIQKLSKHK